MVTLILSDSDAELLGAAIDTLDGKLGITPDELRVLGTIRDQIEMGDRYDVHDAGEKLPILNLYAFVSRDPNGGQGIAASILPGLGSTPLITSSATLATKMASIAEQIHRDSRMAIELYRFERQGEPLWEVP